MLMDHVDHEWKLVKPCVYCVPCNLRLYQGSIPKNKHAHAQWMDALISAARNEKPDAS